LVAETGPRGTNGGNGNNGDGQDGGVPESPNDFPGEFAAFLACWLDIHRVDPGDVGLRSGLGKDTINAILAGGYWDEPRVLRIAIGEVATAAQIDFAGHLLQAERHLPIISTRHQHELDDAAGILIDIATYSRPYSSLAECLHQLKRNGIKPHPLGARGGIDGPSITRVFNGQTPASERVVWRFAAAAMCSDHQLGEINKFLVPADLREFGVA
jgi:hypothetical protein